MDKDTIEARKIYDRFAGRYVELMKRDVERQNLFNVFHFMLGSVRGKKILDAGCGFGKDAKRLAEKGAEVCCLDLSPKMIELAEKKL